MSADGGRRAVSRPGRQAAAVHCRRTPVSPRWRCGLDHHPDPRRPAIDALSVTDPTAGTWPSSAKRLLKGTNPGPPRTASREGSGLTLAGTLRPRVLAL